MSVVLNDLKEKINSVAGATEKHALEHNMLTLVHSIKRGQAQKEKMEKLSGVMEVIA